MGLFCSQSTPGHHTPVSPTSHRRALHIEGFLALQECRAVSEAQRHVGGVEACLRGGAVVKLTNHFLTADFTSNFSLPIRTRLPWSYRP